jgi:transposase
MIQFAWRFLMFQKDSALAQWYRARTADGRGGSRKTMIVAWRASCSSRCGGW